MKKKVISQIIMEDGSIIIPEKSHPLIEAPEKDNISLFVGKDGMILTTEAEKENLNNDKYINIIGNLKLSEKLAGELKKELDDIFAI